MKKISIKNIYLLLIICMGLIYLGIGSTYAVFTASAEIENPITLKSNLTYESYLMDVIEVTVPSGETSSCTLNISNSTDSTLNYVAWYIDQGNTVQLDINSGTPQGSLPPGTSTSVVDITNNTENSITVTLGVSSGVGSLVLSNSMTPLNILREDLNYLMSVTEEQTETSTFLRSNLKRNQIATINFVDNTDVPNGLTGIDVSENKNGSVMIWSSANTSNSSLYDVYIGSNDGITALSSGYYLFSNLTNANNINFNDVVNTKYVTNMSYMFNNSGGITNLSLRNWNTRNVTNMQNMFTGCNKLALITLGPDFSFVGTNSYLPAQSSSNISGAEGLWYDVETNTGYAPQDVHKDATKEVTYAAVSYDITYELNGGTLPDNAPTAFTPLIDSVLPNPTKEGYIFDGWYLDEDLSGESFTSLYGIYDDVTLYAKWTLNIITFTINGTEYQAEGGMTWSQWVDSEYNTLGLTVEEGTLGDKFIVDMDNLTAIWYGGMFVKPSYQVVKTHYELEDASGVL